MKTFLVRSLIFFLTAVAISVGVFFFVGAYLHSGDVVTDAVVDSADSFATEAETRTEDVAEKLKEQIPDEGVPLSSLPLTESQKKALSAVNIDVETFMLTEAMITCAGEKIGNERIAAIVEGSSPSVLEVSKMIPCLGA